VSAFDDHDDEILLDKLTQRAKRFGQVPPEVRRHALAAFSMVNFDDDLAALLRDSADENHLTGVRSGSADIRLLEYAVGNGQLHIGLSATVLTGTLTGRAETAIDFLSGGTRLVLDVDEFGEFTTSGFGSGPVRFEVGSGRDRVVTDWVLPPRS
jgi:hypothetical protein